MFLQKTIISLALASIVTPGVSQMPNVINQTIKNIQTTKSKPNGGVQNAFIMKVIQDHELKFSVTLGNSTYNGFPAWINQICHNPSACQVGVFFFQWLNDNDFTRAENWFPNLNSFTAHGFWHDPFVWSTRLQTHMGHFGPWSFDYSQTCYGMIHKIITNDFMVAAQSAYQKVVNPAGMQFNFDFSFRYEHAGFTVTWLDLGHSYQVLY